MHTQSQTQPGLPGVAPGSMQLAPLPATLAGVPVTQPPYQNVAVNWKHRLDQPYVFLEHAGDYRMIGQSISRMLGIAEGIGLRSSGPLFCLYYDDPGATAVQQLRARVCLPVDQTPAPGLGLGYDVLPSTTVVYSVVAGPSWEVPRVYPSLYDYLAERGWAESGPLRETYLNLTEAPSPQGLLTEVQIPWGARH